MTEIFRGLLAIDSTSIEVGWPLFILAVGLGWIAYFGGKDRIRALGG